MKLKNTASPRPALPAGALERWRTLPLTPAPILTDRSGMADANGIKIHYAIYGSGSPVIFLHGGLANSDYWGDQVPAVAARHTVILMDSRGHGRSTRDARPYGYDLMADDVVALMDALKISKADIVGWSDGGIIGIDLALRHKDRVGHPAEREPFRLPAGPGPVQLRHPPFPRRRVRCDEGWRRRRRAIRRSPDHADRLTGGTYPSWLAQQVLSGVIAVRVSRSAPPRRTNASGPSLPMVPTHGAGACGVPPLETRDGRDAA
jgi:pimeloyl-ACP methyl ester carboxylesterase